MVVAFPASRPPLRLLGAAALVAALVVAAAVLPPSSVAAVPPAHSPVASIVEEEEEEGEEGSEDEFGEEGDGGWVELEPEETEVEDATSTPAAGCPLRSARPAAVVDPAREKLRIALRYTANRSTRVDARFQLIGGRGSLRVRSATRQPARRGGLSFGRHLSPDALAKARAAHVVIVRLDVPSAPARCALTMRLSARHSSGNRETWSGRFSRLA